MRRLDSRSRLHIFALALFFGSGCGGGGCSCMAPLPNGFPAEERVPNSAQARLSESGVSFLEDHIGALAGVLLPGGTVFQVPPSCGGDPPVCCKDGNPGVCRINLDLEVHPGDSKRLELVPTAPSRLDLTIRARVKTLE